MLQSLANFDMVFKKVNDILHISSDIAIVDLASSLPFINMSGKSELCLQEMYTCVACT